MHRRAEGEPVGVGQFVGNGAFVGVDEHPRLARLDAQGVGGPGAGPPLAQGCVQLVTGHDAGPAGGDHHRVGFAALGDLDPGRELHTP